MYLHERDGRIRVFHKSLADWLTDPGQIYHVDVKSGHAALGRECWNVYLSSTSKPNPHTHGQVLEESLPPAYAFRHGVRHLVESKAYPQAVELLHGLYQHPHLVGHPDEAYLQNMARLLGVSLQSCPARTAVQIDPRKLAAVLMRLMNYEPLHAGISLLYHSHPQHWQEIRHGFLHSTDWWVLMYTCSLVLADSYLESPSQTKLSEIHALIHEQDIGLQDMGVYALKIIWLRRPELLDIRLLGELAASDSWTVRGTLYEMMFYLAFNGHKPRELVEDRRFWEPLWDYHRVIVDDILAVERLAEQGQAGPCFLPDSVSVHLKSCSRRSRSAKNLSIVRPSGTKPLSKACSKPIALCPSSSRESACAEPAIERSLHWRPTLRVLLASPYWEVREAMATLVISMAESMPEVIELIEDMLQATNWRLRLRGG